MPCASILLSSSVSAYPASPQAAWHGLGSSPIGLIDLARKLIHITGIPDRLRMHNQPMLIINHGLHVITRMAALTAAHQAHNPDR